VPQGVSPSSGAGPAQTFTFTYTSPVGVSDIYGTAQLIHLNSGVNACMTGVLVHSGTILLYDDPATGYAGVSTVGTPVVLENSQCRVLVGNASVALSGNTATVVIPYEFKASYSGPKNNYSWASSIGGVYSSTIDAGDWTARSQVNSVQPSAASPLQTVTITGVGFGDVPGSVRFNGTTASTITSWTNTAIGVVVPLGATSGAAEVVTNGQASNGVNFTVTASPHISSVSPTWGPPGTQVTVTGANFGSSGTLKLHDEPMTTSGWTDTSVTFTVPTSATTGWVQITSGAPSNQIPFTVGTEEIAYYHTDGIGSVRMTTGHEGYVLSRHDYLPFGTEWIPAPSQDRVRFAGKEHDIETGNGSWMALDYFGARYYESANGRFTSVDPVIDIETSLANPQRWNAYTYVLNNPIRYEDPDGRSATAAGAIIGAVIGAGTAAIQGKSGREIFAAGVGGAVQGAVFGSVIDSGGATLGVLIAAGSLSGTAGRVVENAINGHSTTVEDAVISGVGGAVGAAIGGAAAVRQAARPVSRALVSGADDASLAGSGRLSTQAQKAIRSLQKRIDEHRAKLQAYIKDPDAFDNEGLLRNAPSEAIRNRIIQGRIRHLEHEIAEWERQIYELLKGGGGW
jgi:RHS repeat-associated protein